MRLHRESGSSNGESRTVGMKFITLVGNFDVKVKHTVGSRQKVIDV